MFRRNFVLAMVVMGGALAAADAAVRWASRNSVPRTLIHRLESAPRTVDVLALGNSLMAAGFYPDILEQEYREAGQSAFAVNGAMGATGLVEHLILAGIALRDQRRVGTVVYGFFDQQMASEEQYKNSDLIGNRSMLYYQDPAVASRYMRMSPADRASYEVYRRFDLLIDRGVIWEKVEQLRRRMSEVGMPAQRKNQFGRAADFSLLEASNPRDFIERCQTAVRSEKLLSRTMRDLIQLARNQDANVMVVEMPMPSLHRERFYGTRAWSDFRARTAKELERLDARYVNASDWMDDRLFSDNVHLSREGGIEFTRHLARVLLDLDSAGDPPIQSLNTR